MLQICIRALDYCPPVDCDFGDYLRALITADRDLVSDDPHHYRLAVIEAFRRRGIYPHDVRNLAEEALVWHEPNPGEQEVFRKIFSGPCDPRHLIPAWDLDNEPKEIHQEIDDHAIALHDRLAGIDSKELYRATKLVHCWDPATLYRGKDGLPAIEIHSIRPARRIGPDRQARTELVIEITQRRRGYFDADIQQQADAGKISPPPKPDFIFRGGCTLIVSPDKGVVRYCISKDIRKDARLARMRDFLLETGDIFAGTSLSCRSYRDFFRHTEEVSGKRTGFEPFALLHRRLRSGGDL